MKIVVHHLPVYLICVPAHANGGKTDGYIAYVPNDHVHAEHVLSGINDVFTARNNYARVVREWYYSHDDFRICKSTRLQAHIKVKHYVASLGLTPSCILEYQEIDL